MNFLFLFIDAPKVDDSAAKVWKLSAMDMNDDDIDLVDDDELLDEDDMKKPDPASLRGTCTVNLLILTVNLF